MNTQQKRTYLEKQYFFIGFYEGVSTWIYLCVTQIP